VNKRVDGATANSRVRHYTLTYRCVVGTSRPFAHSPTTVHSSRNHRQSAERQTLHTAPR